MALRLTQQILERETEAYRGSGGTSEESGHRGFRPAFLDTRTAVVYPSRFCDGTPAPFHCIAGLPDNVIAERDPAGRVVSVHGAVVSGFVRDGVFFTRDEAAACVATAH
jgi:hypothetical protein